MSEWNFLGDLCYFINGGAWSDKEYVTLGIPVLKVTNCKDNGFDLSNLNYLPYSSEKAYKKNKLFCNDVVIATVGSHPNLKKSAAGRSIIINKEVEGFYLNQNAVCIRTKNNDVLDQVFLGYYTKYIDFQHYIQTRGKGAANQMRIPISGIKEYKMPSYCIKSQRNIGYILSRYDLLIENNQQRIKLLEEAAKRLYKEWFVDLHFPGYENTKIVDGVPEGWEKGNLSSLAEFRRGKTIVKKEIVEGAIPVVAGGLGSAYYYTKSNTEDRVITVSASGANAGFTRLYYQKIWTSDCSYVDKSMTEHLYFVYCFLKSNKIVIDNLQKGAAQPHVYSKDINALELILPSNKILSLFDAKVIPMFDKIGNLTTQIRLLTEARDRLLPKLMSGELEMYSKKEMHRV